VPWKAGAKCASMTVRVRRAVLQRSPRPTRSPHPPRSPLLTTFAPPLSPPWRKHLVQSDMDLPLPPHPPRGSREPAVGEVVNGVSVRPPHAVHPQGGVVLDLLFECLALKPTALSAAGGAPGVLRLQLKLAATCHSACGCVAERLEAHSPSPDGVQALLPPYMCISWNVCLSEEIALKTLLNKAEPFGFNSQVRHCPWTDERSLAMADFILLASRRSSSRTWYTSLPSPRCSASSSSLRRLARFGWSEVAGCGR
jgi:hypothetical protein